ncbi:hypothetical protein Rsub_04548 [Raphidocelis subcapitata]|uniref:Uncharacterized protein n=1 Tax=Raphidocelis subcapitata TaxID=307507 RepID=A0A2V0NXU2_9CHLO|nr:hypothetical protein Rsub_04548 [Raphidocelis subcapitata]|eukprot:GBF92444.1 hypothetical protein Rsub_04548 [Raphidocelis subcapitata]
MRAAAAAPAVRAPLGVRGRARPTPRPSAPRGGLSEWGFYSHADEEGPTSPRGAASSQPLPPPPPLISERCARAHAHATPAVPLLAPADAGDAWRLSSAPPRAVAPRLWAAADALEALRRDGGAAGREEGAAARAAADAAAAKAAAAATAAAAARAAAAGPEFRAALLSAAAAAAAAAPGGPGPLLALLLAARRAVAAAGAPPLGAAFVTELAHRGGAQTAAAALPSAGDVAALLLSTAELAGLLGTGGARPQAADGGTAGGAGRCGSSGDSDSEGDGGGDGAAATAPPSWPPRDHCALPPLWLRAAFARLASLAAARAPLSARDALALVAALQAWLPPRAGGHDAASASAAASAAARAAARIRAFAADEAGSFSARVAPEALAAAAAAAHRRALGGAGAWLRGALAQGAAGGDLTALELRCGLEAIEDLGL